MLSILLICAKSLLVWSELQMKKGGKQPNVFLCLKSGCFGPHHTLVRAWKSKLIWADWPLCPLSPQALPFYVLEDINTSRSYVYLQYSFSFLGSSEQQPFWLCFALTSTLSPSKAHSIFWLHSARTQCVSEQQHSAWTDSSFKHVHVKAAVLFFRGCVKRSAVSQLWDQRERDITYTYMQRK